MTSRKPKPRTGRGRRPVSRPGTSRSAARLRDVHHQIKNSLQGIASLLGLHAARRPEIADALRDVTHQIQAIAQVYALRAGRGEIRLGALVGAIVAGLRSAVTGEIRLDGVEGERDCVLREREAVPVAMVANELIWNAIKHRLPGSSEAVLVKLAVDRDGEAVLRVRNRGKLPDFARSPSPVEAAGGLELARSLLPPGASALALEAEDGWVCAELRLRPPAIRLRR